MVGIRLFQVALLTALIFLGLSFPLILNFKSSIFADPQWPFDTFGTLYGIWWFQAAWENGVSATQNTLLAHPFGLDWSSLPVQPLLTYPLFIFSFLGGEIFAFNFYVLTNFVATGVAMYGLCYYCTRHERGSLLGALIFTFSSNHLLQSMSHLGFSTTQFIPLFILCWIYFWEKRSWLSAFLCALSVCCLFWSNYYFLYFCLFFPLCYFGVSFFYRGLLAWKGAWTKLLGIGLFCGLLLSPQWVPMAKILLHKDPSAEVQASGYARSQKDVIKYAAHPSDYLLPSEYHPVLSKVTEWVQKNVLKKKRHFSDKTLYLGIFPLIVVFLLIFFRKRFESRDRFLITLFAVSGLFFFWFSLSPWWQIWGLSVPRPSAFLHPLVPMFRYYCRAGFLVSLFVGLLVAYSWKYFPVKFVKEKTRNWVCAAACCLILFEFSVIPPAKNINLASVPEVYTWLKDQPGDFAIVEYPFVRSIKERQQKYMFYQRIHQKKMMNGGDVGTLSDMIRKKAQEIDNPEMWSLLAHFGTKYVLVHKDQERFQQNESLKLVGQMGETEVFEIMAKPQAVHTVFWNFGQSLKWNDEKGWRWIGRTAKIWCLNTEKIALPANLEFKLYSPQENELQVVLNGEVVQTIKCEKEKTKLLKLSKLKLVSGENLIEFKPARLVSHSDKPSRKVSFRLNDQGRVFNFYKNDF